MSNEWWLLILAAIPLFVIWLLALSEVITRPARPVARRIAWVVALLIVPLAGLAVYVIVRPPRRRSLGTWRSSPRRQRGTGRAASLVSLAERQIAGEIDDAAYDAAVREAMAQTS